MILKLFDYFKYRYFGRSYVVGMCLLVKNEEDIIEDNIRFHAAMGVDKFIVTDNGSNDRTGVILKRLSSEFKIIIIDEPSKEFLQSAWTTRMANIAKKENIDWLICCDADEFFVPANDLSFKEIFYRRKTTIINFCRKNMLVNFNGDFNAEDFEYLDANCRVDFAPIFDKKSKVVIERKDLSVAIGKIGEKVAVNLHGLIKIKAGNHNAKHAWPYGREKSNDVLVYHYPFRSYSKFEAQVEALKETVKLGKAQLGQHNYRWSLLGSDEIKAEYRRQVVDQNEKDVLVRFGIATLDDAVGLKIKSARSIK